VIVASPWFHVVRRASAARRLYCFPYAGGTITAFRPLASDIRRDVELCLASLPGRGPRLSEPPEDDLHRLVSSLADGVLEPGAHEFAFFGHSMGALLSFEVARELRRRGSRLPAGVIVSAARAPQFVGSGDERRHHDLPTDEFIHYVRSLGGTAPEVFDSPELMDLLLPALRADFKICESYRHVDGPPLSSPLMVLFGEQDAEVRPQHVAGWPLHTTRECTLRGFIGGHFFIERHWSEVAGLINDFLEGAWGASA